jgi:hypothetical protein
MKAQVNSRNDNLHSEFVSGLDLPELHRQLAALTNPQIHHDLRGMPEIERQAALEKAFRRVNGEHSP